MPRASPRSAASRLTGDARTLHRSNPYWRVETASGPLDAGDVVIALGPWAPDVLAPLGIKLPLAVKRGYHRHFRPQGKRRAEPPDARCRERLLLAPMEQGIRLTTGVEFAARDAAPTPVQFDRLLPAARELFRARRAGRSAAVAGRAAVLRRFAAGDLAARRASAACGSPYGHGHWGLTLGAGDRPAHCRDDDRRDAVLRSEAVTARSDSRTDRRDALQRMPAFRTPINRRVVIPLRPLGRRNDEHHCPMV